MKVDVVVGLSYGDEGKGKVTHHLLREGNYDYCLRYNGGCNAGHTIIHEGKKFVTHHIPAGVFFGIKSIIGNGCVVNREQFYQEIKQLEDFGIQTKGLVYIAKNAHIITDEHLEEDGGDTKIGTTKRGNGPCYRDKYDRTGIRANQCGDLLEDGYVIDLYEEFYNQDEDIEILCEGAQGFGLDVDWGDYPYVTSSHCTSASACLNAIPPQAIRKVYGVTKAYDTYVGQKKFQPDSDIFHVLREAGGEYGATTGRPRQCNWLDLNLLSKSVDINGVTDLIINKVDILRQLDKFPLRHKNVFHNDVLFMKDEETWKAYITMLFGDLETLTFSDSPERI